MRARSACWASAAVGVAGVVATGALVVALEARQPPAGASLTSAARLALVDEYCASCHDEDKKKGGLVLDTIAAHDVARHPDVWEKVVRKLRARQMPPVGRPRPDDAAYDAAIASAGGIARPRGRRESESGPDGDLPAAQPNRVSERHPRPPRARGRRRVAAAGRRVQSRLRQRDGGRPVADAPGPLHHGGARRSAGWRSDVPAGLRAATRSAFGRTSPRRSTSTGSRSARAAAP